MKESILSASGNIILILGWLAFAFWRSRQKNKKKQPPPVIDRPIPPPPRINIRPPRIKEKSLRMKEETLPVKHIPSRKKFKKHRIKNLIIMGEILNRKIK